ncbi:MAG: cbb3-type cytochrome c oxidase subunit 3 [Candidatus Thiodiazotropha sp. (ex Lucinoma aequizonata)]|nr:cbb3-type cytochrome c oxidase subunit 3 [Candidatus Thiodiazotropha sp. (ex Lucinoma aequizonata)]MCU7889876.1 cbb3-type cytochrome c oxidase subunit 3 [Candidatus Thiodiazotropha sp. (ex Lucinoma aequizonata)]MCU7894406.1 cbb3-type cytochrome c oxidase subunit 3 [Candidatus Thiodiazotropha sp. (ex Lucinoma aequizonata)]MCU7898010.1 cbb3-type cytochrome c oxidase subunit 3 [Candidatus Thiodiazotropha sp. (ex Lucinoma aequizonata)]MCU7903530.1 cbb3-type cytochrome c oxidase subunit 3 [Candid
MSSLKEYFYTDWEAMTTSDWFGLVMTVVTFLLMIGVYFYALRPKNREKLEKNRFIPMDDEAIDSGEKNAG